MLAGKGDTMAMAMHDYWFVSYTLTSASGKQIESVGTIIMDCHPLIYFKQLGKDKGDRMLTVLFYSSITGSEADELEKEGMLPDPMGVAGPIDVKV